MLGKHLQVRDGRGGIAVQRETAAGHQILLSILRQFRPVGTAQHSLHRPDGRADGAHRKIRQTRRKQNCLLVQT
ncbi:hypothetical protein ACH49_26130 [Streptomyces leeuwenhoekii]|uniref:Transposase n=1 Tax=Streptomyces leeuwenhoekii TaxID=1437453 RepID=A0ABR5HS45_STRLW|nr:hypothetical protein ACH49_26130 [Streptomyces leeuwenhoekii]